MVEILSAVVSERPRSLAADSHSPIEYILEHKVPEFTRLYGLYGHSADPQGWVSTDFPLHDPPF